MSYETLPKRALIVWEILAIPVYVLLFFLFWIVLPNYSIVWYTILWIIGALFVLTEFLYLPLLYVNVRYRIEQDRIFLQGGVIFTRNHIMVREKISFVTVYSTPIDWLIRLRGLVISAPGSQMMILFLDAHRAEEIADKINEQLIYNTKSSTEQEGTSS